jgi:hypothetical protein
VEKQFVKALFDLECDWEGLPPTYRIYVNDELFTERTFDFVDQYLVEMLQIEAPPGTYQVRIEPQKPCLAKFSTKNHRVSDGTGHWLDEHTLVINQA